MIKKTEIKIKDVKIINKKHVTNKMIKEDKDIWKETMKKGSST